MKLMGTLKLRELARTGADGMPGAAGALCAELEAAVWDCAGDVADQYPAAYIEGGSIRIPIGGTHCIDLIANYKTGMIFIEYAGLVGRAAGARRPRGRRAV